MGLEFRFMSTDEAREEKAHLLLEHQEAEDELNMLKHQAAKLGEAFFQAFGEMLGPEEYGDRFPGAALGMPTIELALGADKIRAATKRFKDLTGWKARLHL